MNTYTRVPEPGNSAELIDLRRERQARALWRKYRLTSEDFVEAVLTTTSGMHYESHEDGRIEIAKTEVTWPFPGNRRLKVNPALTFAPEPDGSIRAATWPVERARYLPPDNDPARQRARVMEIVSYWMRSGYHRLPAYVGLTFSEWQNRKYALLNQRRPR